MMDKTNSKKNKENIATQIEKYKTKTFTKKIEDNEEYLEKQEEEKIEHNSKYRETMKSKMMFRFFALFVIIVFICGTIFIEMEKLKKNPESRDTALTITNNFYNSMVSLQDSWNTIYYFYQTGDLFNILNCKQNTNKTHSSNDKDNLIVLYRDRIDKKINTNLLKDVSCGQKIYVYLEQKKDVEQSSSNNKELYSFIVGEEPVELLTKFPLLKYALYKIKVGEKATFVARQQLSQRAKIKNQTIYNMEIISQDNNEISNKLPPYIIYNENVGKIDIKGQTICNSNLNIKYTITDIDDNKLYDTAEIIKINIGSGLFNPAIEQLLLKTHSHEEIKIFLSKKFYKPSKYLPESLFKNRDVIVINIKIY